MKRPRLLLTLVGIIGVVLRPVRRVFDYLDGAVAATDWRDYGG